MSPQLRTPLTLTHLDVLAVAGRLRRSDTDGISHYAKD